MNITLDGPAGQLKRVAGCLMEAYGVHESTMRLFIGWEGVELSFKHSGTDYSLTVCRSKMFTDIFHIELNEITKQAYQLDDGSGVTLSDHLLQILYNELGSPGTKGIPMTIL